MIPVMIQLNSVSVFSFFDLGPASHTVDRCGNSSCGDFVQLAIFTWMDKSSFILGVLSEEHSAKHPIQEVPEE